MQKRVYILGGYQSDFAQNWYRNELDLLDVFEETIAKGLQSVDLEPKDVDVAHVGNFTAELFCNQGHLGGFFVSSHPTFLACHLQGMKLPVHLVALQHLLLVQKLNLGAMN